MINKVYAIGRQTADPTQSVVGGVPCTNFSLASDTKNKDADGEFITNFYRIAAWRGLAETVAKYLHKGDRVAVMGDLLFRTYKDKNGTDRAAMQVTLTDIEFLNGPRTETAGNTPPNQARKESRQSQKTYTQVTTEDDNDELPF